MSGTISVSKFKRKPSLVRQKEESAAQHAERKRYTRSMLEERTGKFEETTLTEGIVDKDGKAVLGKDGQPVKVPMSRAYELARAGEIASGGWNLGKIAPIIKDNILALKRYVVYCNILELDLGREHPATKYAFMKLQSHFLTLFPRSITYDAKDVDMVEAQPSTDVMMQEISRRLGLGLPIATDLGKRQEQQEAEES